MGQYYYDYSDAIQFCREQGLQWAERWVEQADAAFHEAGLTQDQVNRMMRLYIVNVKQLFNPKAYTLCGRIGLAFWFLFGKHKG